MNDIIIKDKNDQTEEGAKLLMHLLHSNKIIEEKTAKKDDFGYHQILKNIEGKALRKKAD